VLESELIDIWTTSFRLAVGFIELTILTEVLIKIRIIYQHRSVKIMFWQKVLLYTMLTFGIVLSMAIIPIFVFLFGKCGNDQTSTYCEQVKLVYGDTTGTMFALIAIPLFFVLCKLLSNLTREKAISSHLHAERKTLKILICLCFISYCIRTLL
jgi:hypothetical protein